MIEIPENWKKVLDFLVQAPVAWQSATDIARTLLWDVEETTDLLSDMDVAGWVSVWVIEPEPVVTLSALAAYHYHVVLVEIGPKEQPRWSLLGEPDPVPPRAKNVASCDHHARQDKILDPSPSPDLVLEQSEIQAERAAHYRRRLAATCRVEDLPLPCHLLGQNRTAWPGPTQSNDPKPQRCPVCAGRPLLPHVYCLYCNRWGLDDVLRKLLEQSAQSGRPSDPASRQSTPNEAASVSALADSSPDGPPQVGVRPRDPKPSKGGRARRKALRKMWRTVRSVKG
jgi:hypothetical protein